MLETMKTNWKRVCEQLKDDSELSSFAEEKKVLLTIEKNVYHRKTASPVIIAEVYHVYIIYFIRNLMCVE